jgi:nucleoside-diphosphate-sugar epimerase
MRARPRGLIADRPEVIFHLAAIVSGEAEAEFDKGYRINLDGTRYLIEAIRHAGGGYKPRLVFTSSIAVFGAPFPEKIGDEFFHTPLTSYGTQKLICEALINDYTRKGMLEGISIRLPDHLRAAGQAQQGRFRLLLQHHPRAARGQEAVLPVSEDVRHWHATPKSAVGFLVHAGTMDLGTVGARRNLSDAGPVRHRRRADRGLRARRRQERRLPHQARAGSIDHQHRRRLAAQFLD